MTTEPAAPATKARDPWTDPTVNRLFGELLLQTAGDPQRISGALSLALAVLESSDGVQRTIETLAKKLKRMSPTERQQALRILKVMVALSPVQ